MTPALANAIDVMEAALARIRRHTPLDPLVADLEDAISGLDAHEMALTLAGYAPASVTPPTETNPWPEEVT